MQRRQLLTLLAGLPVLASGASLSDLEAEAARRRAAYRDELRRLARETPVAIYDNPLDPVLGPAAATRSVLVFTDYNCPYCRKLDPVIAQLAGRADAPARFVLKLLTIMDPGSALASAFALRVWQQQPRQFSAAHHALMTGPLPLTTAALKQIARQSGTQASLAEADAAAATLTATQQLAQRLQVYATPSLLIGARIMSGMTDAATLRQEIVRWPMEA
ncbi:DsbA family protein [Chitinilyticum piscinae]|uniref:Thioredoxin domain-containing protein n=1 Tax=Chitinilyticum piscinae TaxID=2866724 RepID=A0A8J7K1C2_9NEIS|nr:thioredoxin domain-containing protein [Chitinilyticum piscinae]MBE9609011.1 thioredoxin domain-containing protein [Chitinilyticum piscinae]